MNYHFMIDDKFIDGFIDDMESAAPDRSVYVVTSDGPTEHVTSQKCVRAAYGSPEFEEIAQQIENDDHVYIHWLHDAAARFILDLPKGVQTGAFFWGGDFIENPFYVHKKRLLGKRSLKIYNSELEHPQPSPKSPLKMLKNVFHKHIRYKKIQARRQALKRRAVQRLDLLLHWNLQDHEDVETFYETELEPRFFFYDVGLQTEIGILENPYIEATGSVSVWLGNSSTITNNHAEAIEFLGGYENDVAKIFCPLSYGDSKYGDIVEELGQSVFGSKFIAMRDFMDRNDYYALMDQADIVVMNHQRTQAAGNIWAFLKMGKKIYMDPRSSLYRLLFESGIRVFKIPAGPLEYREFSSPLDTDTVRSNSTIMHELFSECRKKETLESL